MKAHPDLASCPVCRSTDVADFLDLGALPRSPRVAWPTPEDARTAPRGEMRLGFCTACGHVFNRAFVPDGDATALDGAADPVHYLRLVAEHLATGDGQTLHLEVPNVGHTLKELVVWDFDYERPSYFCAESLRHAFQNAGLAVRNLYTTHADQVLHCEAIARPARDADYEPINLAMDLTQTWLYVGHFNAQYQRMLDLWQARLDRWRDDRMKVVLWGWRSRSATFLNVLQTQGRIEHVVDLDPGKRGQYLAGSGQQFADRESLVYLRPDVIIAMNPDDQEEISRQVTALGLEAEFLTG